MMRLSKIILFSVAAMLPATAYAQTYVGAEASSASLEAIEKPRASRVSNPDSPRNLLRRALIQAAKSHTVPSGLSKPKSDQLAVVTVSAQ